MNINQDKNQSDQNKNIESFRLTIRTDDNSVKIESQADWSEEDKSNERFQVSIADAIVNPLKRRKKP